METRAPASAPATHATGTAPATEETTALLAQLRATHDAYTALAATYSEEQMHRQPAPGEWSGAQTIAHLADLDLFYRTERFPLILMADTPTLPSYDPDARMAAGNFGAMTTAQALDFLKTERDALLMLLEGLRPHEWARVGVHPERGPKTLYELAGTLAAHGEMHMAQVQAAAGR